MRLRLFGPPALLGRSPDGPETIILPAGKPLLILAYLAAHSSHWVTRDTLALLVWGNRDETHAKASLRQALYRLRQLMGREALESDDHAVRLVAVIASDWSEAMAMVRSGDDAGLVRALAGPFLEGLETDEGDDAGHWLGSERDRWRLQLREAALREGRRVLTAGDPEAALGIAERALAAQEDHLASWELLLDALSATEISTRLEAGLARLEAAGERGFLGVGASSGWQLLLRRFRRGAGSTAPGQAAGLAPGAVLPFTGRGAILAHLQQLISLPSDGHRRVVMLIAAPGFGKSRLLRELRGRLVNPGFRVTPVEALAGESMTPWSLLNRLVEVLAAYPEASGIDPSEASALVALNPRLAERFASISVVERSVPDATTLAKALTELISAVSDHHRLHILVDDSQWADIQSMQVLRMALAEQSSGHAVCLLATRDDATLHPADWQTVHLPSLSHDDLAVLVASQLPALPRHYHADAATALLLVTGGVPLYIARGLHQLVAMVQQGADDTALLEAIPNLALHRDPAFPAGEIERNILGYLAIAGSAISREELAAMCSGAVVTSLEERLARLGRQGWIVGSPAGVRLSHDLVQRQVIEVIEPKAQRALALQRAHWLVASGDALHDLQNAVRIYLDHDEPALAAAAVRSWCRRVRGGARGRALVSLLLPSTASWRWRVRLTAAATPALLGSIVVLCGTIAVVGWAMLLWLRQPATLQLENLPRVQNIVPGAKVRRNAIAPLLSVRDRLGNITHALDGAELRIVGWSADVDSAMLDAGTVIHNGTVIADRLEAYFNEQDSVQIIFAAGSLPPLAVTVARGFGVQSLAVVGGILNGTALEGAYPEVVVAPGDSLTGSVTLQYTTPSVSALWMLGESSTMGPLHADTITVITLHTGAINALTDAMVRRKAPMVPGSYWLVYAFAAEGAAEWIFSLTNWRCATPHWNDGNDLLAMPDSAFERLGGGGFLHRLRDLCEEGEPPTQVTTRYPAAAIRIVVK